ncbi:protein G12-like [Lutzomyia longipalpis]|uniref:protein G12-like n=1 Tax=Lutzomyia longipalpis TaxID=7200 RepID=UPI002483DEC3|nr:protein G12-like [Lutzomyia longipalpis]
MRFHVVVLAVLVGAAWGNPVGNFRKDIDEILSLLPIEKMRQIAEDYYHTDGEIQEIVTYLKGDEAKKIYSEIMSMKEVREFVEFLGSQGLKTERFASLEELLRLPKEAPDATKASMPRTGGLLGLISDIKDCLPQKELRRVLVRKLTNSPGFAAVYKRIQDFDFVHLEEYANQSKEIAAFVKRMNGYGIDVDKLVKQFAALVGWHKDSDDDFDVVE